MKRGLLLALFALVVGAVALFGPAARASVSIAVTWDELLARSSAAVVGIPAEARSAWENGRIYTYTRVGVDRAIAGDLHAGDDVWVRTMGGIVGDVGQRVDGEAVLIVGRPSILFLSGGAIGSYDVVARGQGQFPVVLDEQKNPKAIRSSAVGVLMMPRGVTRNLAASVNASVRVLAADKIHGRRLDDVAADVAGAWDHAHGK
jgi:hypothetical protein